VSQPLARILLGQAATLAISGIGAAILGGLLRVPGGWLSGAMIGLVFWSASRHAAPIADPVRRLAMIASGVAVGSAMTPALAKGVMAYPLSIALMLVSICLATYASARWLRRREGFDHSTAFFSSVPGALSYVFAVAAETDANLVRVAIVQLFRLFCLMVLVPIAVAEVGVPVVSGPVGEIDSPLVLALLFPAAAAFGFVIEKTALPAGLLFGAMIASGLAHLTGLAPGRLPAEFIDASQWLVGAWVGSRFINLDWRLAMRTLGPALGAFALALLVSVALAGVTTLWLGIPFAETLIAFSPGALEAMTVLAFALGLDPLYVSAHHLGRFVFISLVLPFAVKAWRGLDKSSTHEAVNPLGADHAGGQQSHGPNRG